MLHHLTVAQYLNAGTAVTPVRTEYWYNVREALPKNSAVATVKANFVEFMVQKMTLSMFTQKAEQSGGAHFTN